MRWRPVVTLGLQGFDNPRTLSPRSSKDFHKDLDNLHQGLIHDLQHIHTCRKHIHRSSSSNIDSQSHPESHRQLPHPLRFSVCDEKKQSQTKPGFKSDLCLSTTFPDLTLRVCHLNVFPCVYQLYSLQPRLDWTGAYEKKSLCVRPF